MKNDLPLPFTLVHALASGLSAYASWPLQVFAGFETESVILAAAGAVFGTALGLTEVRNKWPALLLIGPGLLLAASVVTYARLLAKAGATTAEFCVALVLFLATFLIFFYLVTRLERAVRLNFLQARRRSGRGSPASAGAGRASRGRCRAG